MEGIGPLGGVAATVALSLQVAPIHRLVGKLWQPAVATRGSPQILGPEIKVIFRLQI